jgi:hypothetical protein
LIEEAKSLANEGGFAVALETDEGEYKPALYPSAPVCKIVAEFYEKLSTAEHQIRKDLQSGPFTRRGIS